MYTINTNINFSQQGGGASGTAVWLWQDDHDNWVKYDATTSEALEFAFSQGSNEGRVDDERLVLHLLWMKYFSDLYQIRYVDFDSMLQRRFDNQNKKRYVKRQVQLSEANKAKIEKSRQEALKKLASNNANQPKIYSFWVCDTSS